MTFQTKHKPFGFTAFNQTKHKPKCEVKSFINFKHKPQ